MKTGLTERTLENMQLNAGMLVKSYTKGENIHESDIIGATRGGGSISITATMRQAAVDGAPTYTKGLERVDEYVCQANFTFVEFTAQTIKRALVGSTVATVDGDTKITAVSKILENDYEDIYWVGENSDGKNIVIKLKNALSTGGFSLSVTDKNEGTFAMTLTAHYDVNDLETAPFDLIIEG